MSSADDPIQQREIAQAIEIAARQREIDLRWAGHVEAHESHDKVHNQEHITEREVTRLHEAQLTRAFAAHEEKHKADDEAIRTALASVKELATIHETAHKREHDAHDQRHVDASTAVDKAEQSVEKRLEGMNGIRGDLREQARTFATSERVEQLQTALANQFAASTKHTDERYEENRRRIELLEKGDVKAEGRTLGQGAVIAIIITAIGVVGAVLSVIVTLANLATSTP